MNANRCCATTTKWLPLLLMMFVLGGTLFAMGIAAPQEDPPKMLRHVVLFKFKEANTSDQNAKVLEAFKKLPSQIAEVATFECGTDVSPEGLADGFTHCCLIGFRSDKDRDIYLKHEAHQRFVELALPRLDKVLVVDFWNQP